MRVNLFKIRCSAIGQIMTEPKTKADKEAGELSETAKSYCKTWLKEQIYAKRKDITTKYMNKGNVCEGQAIQRLNEYLGTFYSKNEELFENDFCKGTPDIVSTEIIDIKNSFDCFTFPLFDKEIENKDYVYQLQGYMWLTGIKKAKLVYVLENLPDDMIEKELYYKGLDYTKENELLYKYDNVENDLRIKIFEIDYNPEIISKIISQVLKCRNYINKLIENL